MHRPSGRVIKDSQCTHVKRLLWHDEYLQVWMFRRACDLSSKLSEVVSNTFNSIERVYSRAIVFSNPTCSVPLECSLPMTLLCTPSSSIRTTSALIAESLTPPILTLSCVAPSLCGVLFPPWGRACTYWGRHLHISCGCALSWHPFGQTSSFRPGVAAIHPSPTLLSLISTG